jgi:hypothetical protein
MVKAKTRSLWNERAASRLKADLDPLAVEERIIKDVAAATSTVVNTIPVSTRGPLLHLHAWLSKAMTLRPNIPITAQMVYATQRVKSHHRKDHRKTGATLCGEQPTWLHHRGTHAARDKEIAYLPLTLAPILASIGRVE